MRRILEFGTNSDWTALGNDSTGKTALVQGVWDQTSIQFDKVNGADNNATAGVYRSVSAKEDLGKPSENGFWRSNFRLTDYMAFAFYVGAITNVLYAVVRLGATSSNYLEWRFHDSQMLASSWNLMYCQIGDCAVAGTGGDLRTIRYAAAGVTFDAEGDALANIALNGVWLVKADIVSMAKVTD